MRFRLLSGLISLVFMVFASTALAATTFYVAPSGSDSGAGSQYAPFKTIQLGVNRMASGDTLILRGGTYYEAVNINKPRVTIKNYPGETAVIDGREKIPTSLWSSLISISASDVVVEGLQLYRSKERGVTILPGGDRARCTNLRISYCWREGFALAGPKTLTADAVLENSQIYRNVRRFYYYNTPSEQPDPNYAGYGGPWDAQVAVVNGLRTIVRNNKIYESYFEGLGLYAGSERVLAENNEIYANDRLQVYLSSSRLCTVRNNMIYGTASWWGTRSAAGIAGIWLGGENWTTSHLSAEQMDYGHKVYGNFIANSHNVIIVAGESNTLARDSYIYNNILVEAVTRSKIVGTNVKIGSGVGGTGNVFANNAILQSVPQVDVVNNINRVSFSHNLWNQKQSPNARGDADLVNSFNLLKDYTSPDLVGGTLKSEDFSLATPNLASSLAIDKGTWLTTVSMPNGASNSTVIVVANAGFFHGDERIKFENGQTTTIQNISGNTLKVNPAVTVSNGTGLALLDYTSRRPNIGPWKLNGTSPPIVKLAAPGELKILP